MSNLEVVVKHLNFSFEDWFFSGAKNLDDVRDCIDNAIEKGFSKRFIENFAKAYDYAKFLSSLTDEEWFIKKTAQVEFEIIETGFLDIPDDIAQDDDKLEDYVAGLDVSDYQDAMPDDADIGSTYLNRHETVQIRLTDAVISKLQDALIEEKVS